MKPKLKPAEVFLSCLNLETTEHEVVAFVTDIFPKLDDVSCEKLHTKYRSYSYFPISLNGVPFSDALNSENWLPAQ